MASPMSVPPRGALPTSTSSSTMRKKPWSLVSGTLTTGLPAKTISPTRSPARCGSRSRTSDFARSSRLGATSSAVIERETSRSTNRSTPRWRDGLGVDAEPRPGRGDDQQRHARQEQDALDPGPRPAQRRHEPLDHGRIDEAPRGGHPFAMRVDQQPCQQGQDPECQQDDRVFPVHGNCETASGFKSQISNLKSQILLPSAFPHGRLLNRVPARTTWTRISPSPGSRNH